MPTALIQSPSSTLLELPVVVGVPLPVGMLPLTSPIRGRMASFSVSSGSAMQAGTTVCVLESMKMEMVVAAPVPGVLARWLVAIGDSVLEGQTVAWLEALPAGADVVLDDAAKAALAAAQLG